MIKKAAIITVNMLVLVSAGGIAYALAMRADNSQPSTSSDKHTRHVEDMAQNDTDSAMTPTEPSVYGDYSEEAVADADGVVLLFFHAPWCPQCRSIDASINKGGVPEGVTVLKVDYDSNQALRQRYGVTLQTTFVKVDNTGKKLESYVAYQEPTFDSVKKALLP